MDNHRRDGYALLGSSGPEDDEGPPRGRSRWTEAPRRSRRRQEVDTNMGIPLSNMHGRQGRDDDGESGDEDIYHQSEQEASLLDPLGYESGHDSPKGDAECGTLRRAFQEFDNRYGFIFRKKVFLFVILIVIMVGLLSVLCYFVVGRPRKQSLYNLHPDRTLGILLHPEDHVYRLPRQLTQYWNITSEYRSPDGVRKKVYLVNGQFPGPLIECRPGDRFSIHVANQLKGPDEKISIHWHGLNMRNQNHMDGASSFTQCPISPNRTFTYEFEIDSNSEGTFWYHAHSGVQRGDGMYGGLVVHDAKATNRELSRYRYKKEVLLLIGDWYHNSTSDVLDWYMSIQGSKNVPVPDSLLINGAGKFACSRAGLAPPIRCHEKWKDITPGLFDESIRGIPIHLRVVNVGSLAGFTLGVSSGSLTPLTVDGGHPIKGKPSDSVGILYPGERVDILLEWVDTSKSSQGRMLISLDQENFKYLNSALTSHQLFPFFTSKSIDTDALMRDWKMGVVARRGPFALNSTTAALTQAHKYHQVPQTADQMILLYVKTEPQFGIRRMGFINGTSWVPQAIPQVPLNGMPRQLWDSNQLVPFIPIQKSKPIWVDIILNNMDYGSHPFHLHGYNFYVVESHRSEVGNGWDGYEWDGYSPWWNTAYFERKPNLNLVDPLKKDTVNVPGRGYVILRFLADNPGIWMFHCHVLFHMASGMSMGLHVWDDQTNIDYPGALEDCHDL